MPDAPDDSTADEATQTAAPESDPLREGIVTALRRAVGDKLLDHHIAHHELWVRVDRSAWADTARYLKEQQHFEYFCFLSGIDWLRSDEFSTRYEKVWPEPAEDREPATQAPSRNGAAEEWKTGLAGGDARFQVFARFFDPTRKLGITVKADLDNDSPAVESLVGIFRGADWHEREAWEMFGFDFPGHPGLRHIYLPGEFEGHPLRKDFPLLSRVVKPWPGLVDKEPIPGEGEGEGEEAEAESSDSEESA